MRLVYFIFIGCLFFSCKPNAPEAAVVQPEKPVTEVIKPAPPVLPNQKPIDGAWADYWNKMQEAANSKSRSLMTSMIAFPFPLDGQMITAENYAPYHKEVFDRNVIQKIKTTKAIDVDSYKLYGAEYKKSMAKQLGLKEGVKVYKLGVIRFTQVEGVLTPVGTDFYHFPKFERGGFRLAWIERSKL